MVYENPQSSKQSYGSQVAQTAQHLREKVTEQVSHVRDFVKGRTSDVTHQVQDTAVKAKDAFSHAIDEYPLAVGAGFVMLGLAAGLAIPTTKPERRYIGQAGRRLMDQAQEVGSQLIDKGEQVAERAVDVVRSTIKSGASAGNKPGGAGYSAGSRLHEHE